MLDASAKLVDMGLARLNGIYVSRGVRRRHWVDEMELGSWWNRHIAKERQ